MAGKYKNSASGFVNVDGLHNDKSTLENTRLVFREQRTHLCFAEMKHFLITAHYEV